MGRARLTDEQGLVVVQAYLRGGIGPAEVKRLAGQLHVTVKCIRDWRQGLRLVETYRLHEGDFREKWRRLEAEKAEELPVRFGESCLGRLARLYRHALAGGGMMSQAVTGPYWRELHVRRLIDLAEAVRRCLYNPQLQLVPYIGPWPHLEVNGEDWSLEPDMWLALVTPDFDDPALWGELFPAFREHTQASPFWQHLEELKRAVEEVEGLHGEAATRLGEKDPAFRAAWEKFEAERGWRTPPSRTLHSPEAPADEKPLRGPGFTVRVLDGFERLGFGVRARHRWLVELLQKLNEDMMPDRIERLIEEGTCSLCR